MKYNGFMVPKAFCKSISIVAVKRPESKLVSILSVRFERQVPVEWLTNSQLVSIWNFIDTP